MRLGLFILLCQLACHSDRGADRLLPTRSETRLPVGQEAPRRPLAVRWIVREREEGRLALAARFHFGSGLQEPLHVTVSVPAGLKLVSGEQEFDLQPPANPGPVEREYEFAVESTPVDALVLEASAQSESAGLHARAMFEFTPSPGERDGQESVPHRAPVRVNGKHLGSPRALR